MKNIAVVILNWNGKSWLEKFLSKVLMYSHQAQVYVIDNASTDDSINYILEFYPSVKIIQNGKNIGFTGGYNEGLRQVKEEYYCLLNSDVEVTDGWIAPVLDLFERDKSIAVIQPKILSYYQKTRFEFAGAGGGFIDNLGYPYCRGRIFEHIEADLGQYDDETQIFWASGCCLFIRREDFWRVNGFDEIFFAHQEEIDLCWRLNNQGRKVFYTGKSTVYHVGGGTLNKQNPRKTFLNIRNNLLMLLKNLPFLDILWVIPLRLILDLGAVIYFAYKEGIEHIWAVFKAHLSFYTCIYRVINSRGKIQISNYYQRKWIVFCYFLRIR